MQVNRNIMINKAGGGILEKHYDLPGVYPGRDDTGTRHHRRMI